MYVINVILFIGYGALNQMCVDFLFNMNSTMSKQLFIITVHSDDTPAALTLPFY